MADSSGIDTEDRLDYDAELMKVSVPMVVRFGRSMDWMFFLKNALSK